MARIANDVIGTLLGEAGGKTVADRYRDMLGIASVMANRAVATGQSLQSIVSAPNQFSAYGKSLPKGVEKFEALARMAVEQVTNWGPVHNATYYATPAATKNLPKGLNPVTETTAHQYFDDPQNRAIGTAQGYVRPDPSALAAYAPASAGSIASNAFADLGAVRSNLADVSYSMGPNRPNAPSQGIVDIARSAVRDTLGPGYSVDVISGMEDPGQQYGSNRHRTGLAADVQIRDPAGNLLSTNANRQQMMDVAQAMAAKGALGIGIGTNYMGGIGIHVDQVTPGPGQTHTWGNLGKAYRDQLTEAMATKEMPASFYANAMPSQMAVPGVSAPSAIASGVPAQSVKTSSFSPPAGTVNDMPDTAGIGFFGGQAGSFGGVPAKSVKTTSYTPDTAVASIDTSKSAYAPEESPASKALADLATRTKDDAITEIAGAPVGQSAVAPSNAYATTNLPGYGYTPPSVTAMAPEPVAPAPIEVAPPAAITPPSPVFTPQTVAPAPVAAPARAAAAPSIPSGTKAALDFHAGLNNAAVASNGNTLTRDAMGYSYNYSPEFDVTTISNPAGDTVGVKQGKVTADSAGVSTASSGGLLDGLGKALGGIGDSLGGIFSKDDVSNAVVGGLGGLGGAAVGGLLGPVGSVIGSAIGRQLAVQNNPFATPGAQPSTGLFGLGGLGGLFGGIFGGRNSYPSAPNAPSALGGRQSNRSVGEMRGISPRAAGDIEAGRGGLF